MNWIDERKLTRLAAPDLSVKPEDARTGAQFALYLMVAAGFEGCAGWDRARIAQRPLAIYDLCGLPLFFDFHVRRGAQVLGSIRMAATKVFGHPLISVSVTPPQWSLASAKQELERLLKKKYPGYTAKTPRLVCYNYPTVGLSVEITRRGREVKTVLMDVADFSEVDIPRRVSELALGQVPHSLLARLSRSRERTGPRRWNERHKAILRLLQRHRNLAPRRFYMLPSKARAQAIEKLLATYSVQLIAGIYLDYCCHGPITGPAQFMNDFCRDHPCFCLHLQDNENSCARAVCQMMLCYWRYCSTQQKIARASNEPFNQVTDPSKIKPGLEKLTRNCFEATLLYSALWQDLVNEIQARRPFLLIEGNHATACAGFAKVSVGTNVQKFVYTFDPSKSGNGKAWVEYDPVLFVGMVTLVRRTTLHS